MRRNRKPWPPSNVSPDAQPPKRFLDAERDYLAELAATPAPNRTTSWARSHFDRLDKQKLREVLLCEQGFLCIYCERSITNHHSMRIDHWRPLSLNHSFVLHWNNLYLSCPARETCDNAKGERPLSFSSADPDPPWPVDFDYQRYIGFSSSGEMYIRNDVAIDEALLRALLLTLNDQTDGSQSKKTTLNLNHPTLIAARAAAIDSERHHIKTQFPGKTASRIERQRIAESKLRSSPLPQFVSIRVAWLTKEIGNGR